MDYQKLTRQERRNVLTNRIKELETQHYSRSLDVEFNEAIIACPEATESQKATSRDEAQTAKENVVAIEAALAAFKSRPDA